MNSKKQLPQETYLKMCALGEQGRAYKAAGQIDDAERRFLDIWALIPEPKGEWDVTESLAVSTADFFISTGQTQKALAWIPNLALSRPIGTAARTTIMLGRIYLLAGEQEKAREQFQKAYDADGKDAFRGDNKAYLKFVQPPKATAKRKAARAKPGEWPAVPSPEAYKLMAGPLELDEDAHEKIQHLCATGDALAQERKFDAAVEKYREALSLVPPPLEKWDASTWIYTAIADARFLQGDFGAAAEALRTAMYCPGAKANAFVRLRRGQVALEQGDVALAQQEMIEAYALAGEEVFSGEHPKYWEWVTLVSRYSPER